MRYLLILSLVLPCMGQLGGTFPGPGTAHSTGGGAITLISHAAAAGPNSATTSAIDTTGATLLIVTIGCYDHDPATGTPVTDSKGNTWHPLTSVNTAGFEADTVMWYAWNATAGSGHTVTVSLLGAYAGVTFSAFSGIRTGSDPLGATQSKASGGGGTTIQPGSITPATSGTLVITTFTAGGAGSGFSINSGFSIIDSVAYTGGNNEGNASAYLVQSPAAAVNPTWSLSVGAADRGATIAYFTP